SQLGVLLPNICQLIPSAVLLVKNKLLANKDYLLLLTTKHLPGAAIPAQAKITICKKRTFPSRLRHFKIR
ncbi:hypothetical protein, partial [Klebsiella pneumoniae]|uniref:hypothetical protein n=1 Tax=Klebsiella pneumoniae TaxID=573 RepID=UPI002F96AE04